MAPWLASPTNLAYLAKTPLVTGILGAFHPLNLAAISSSLTSISMRFFSASAHTLAFTLFLQCRNVTYQ